MWNIYKSVHYDHGRAHGGAFPPLPFPLFSGDAIMTNDDGETPLMQSSALAYDYNPYLLDHNNLNEVTIGRF